MAGRRSTEQSNLRAVHARADGAAELLAHPTLQLAYDSIEQTIVNDLANLDITDRDREHELVQLLRASRMHRATLHQWVQDGNALGAQQERENKESERFPKSKLV